MDEQASFEKAFLQSETLRIAGETDRYATLVCGDYVSTFRLEPDGTWRCLEVSLVPRDAALGWAAAQVPLAVAACEGSPPPDTDCSVLRMLDEFASDVRHLRALGNPWEVVTAPWCGTDGVWRAEVRKHDYRLQWRYDEETRQATLEPTP